MQNCNLCGAELDNQIENKLKHIAQCLYLTSQRAGIVISYPPVDFLSLDDNNNNKKRKIDNEAKEKQNNFFFLNSFVLHSILEYVPSTTLLSLSVVCISFLEQLRPMILREKFMFVVHRRSRNLHFLHSAKIVGSFYWSNEMCDDDEKITHLTIRRQNGTKINLPTRNMITWLDTDVEVYFPPCLSTLIFRITEIDSEYSHLPSFLYKLNHLSSLDSLTIYCAKPLSRLPSLPNNLKKLEIICGDNTIGYYLRQNEQLPPSLTSISGILLESTNTISSLKLTSLDISTSSYDDITLPPSTKHCTIEPEYNHPVTLSLPEGIQSFSSKYFQISFSSPIPTTLTKLQLYYNKAFVFPPSITHLTLLLEMQDTPLPLLPSSLKTLILDGFNDSINHLPPSLTYLDLGESFEKPLSILPNGLTTLKLGRFFTQKIDSLPPSLTRLKFGMDFNHPLDFLPSSILSLTLGRFNQQIDNIPKSLRKLAIFPSASHDYSKLTHLTRLKFMKVNRKPSPTYFPSKLPQGIHLTYNNTCFKKITVEAARSIAFFTKKDFTYRPFVLDGTVIWVDKRIIHKLPSKFTHVKVKSPKCIK